MTALLTLKASTLALLMVAVFTATLCQTVHTLTTWECRKKGTSNVWGIAYELMVTAALITGMFFAHACYEYLDGFPLRIWTIAIPLPPLMHLNACAAVISVCAAIRMCKPLLAGDALALLCLFPPLMNLADARVLASLYAAWFFARGIYALYWDRHAKNRESSRHLVNEAFSNLPEGVLLAQANGRILLINETMRNLLLSLGGPIRLADSHELWQALENMGSTAEQGALMIKNPQGQSILFYQLKDSNDGPGYERYWAYDVTEAIELSRQIEQANAQLALVASQLKEQLERVEQVAENEAVLAMKSRVHDVISQRLSILQSLLQSGDISKESLDYLKPLLTSILDDLASDANTSEALSIDSLQRAFALIGVDIEMEGDLPKDQAVAQAFVKVVREAATNAVRHGQAKKIMVRAAKSDALLTLTVANDGAPAHEVVEGNGIGGMRRRIQQLGGSLDITCLEPFTLKASIPKERQTS